MPKTILYLGLDVHNDVGGAIAHSLQSRKVQAGSRRIFCAIRTGQALCPAAIGQVVRRALQQAGIRTTRRGAHLLRRTLASHLIQRGVSLKEIADLLGHRSLDTTRLWLWPPTWATPASKAPIGICRRFRNCSLWLRHAGVH